MAGTLIEGRPSDTKVPAYGQYRKREGHDQQDQPHPHRTAEGNDQDRYQGDEANEAYDRQPIVTLL